MILEILHLDDMRTRCQIGHSVLGCTGVRPVVVDDLLAVDDQSGAIIRCKFKLVSPCLVYL